MFIYTTHDYLMHHGFIHWILPMSKVDRNEIAYSSILLIVKLRYLHLNND